MIVPIGDFPIGTVAPFAGPVNEAQLEGQGWMYCNGNSISRTTYADLFGAIGTAYGEGDGSSTFNLPNFRGSFQRGVSHGSGNDPDAALRTASGAGAHKHDVTGGGDAETRPINVYCYFVIKFAQV